MRERDLVDQEGVGGCLREAGQAVAAGEPAAEDFQIKGGDGGGGREGELAEEEGRQRPRRGGGGGAKEDLVAEHSPSCSVPRLPWWVFVAVP